MIAASDFSPEVSLAVIVILLLIETPGFQKKAVLGILEESFR
jgi:hypothetical protein